MKEGLTPLWPAHAALGPAQLVADRHEDLAQTLTLPRREDDDAGQVVVVPAHLLFGEEANNLACTFPTAVSELGRRGVVHKEEEREPLDVEADRLAVEEELPEQRSVLAVELEMRAEAREGEKY